MTGLDDATTLRIFITVAISTVLTMALGAAAAFFPRAGDKFFRRVEQNLAGLAERKALMISLIFVCVIVLRLLALPFLPVPVPGIHDEQSYLLMADTFAHGRLTNPPHPMWISFETFHVNWLPTYASMYPPAQGAALALGQALGHPWIGVLLSSAAMCAAILWMLQGWMPARWAFLGGALAALKFGVASYWMNSYWGGAVPAAGGALVLGALARIVRHASVANAILLGLGIAILANSRPYEGFLFCIPAAVWFLWWLGGKGKHKETLAQLLRSVFVPLLVVLILTAAFMGYYNWRITGDPLEMPYLLNIRTYHTSQIFLWSRVQPEKHYNNQQFEDFYNDWERQNYQGRWSDLVRITEEKLIRDGLTYFWVGELLLLPALPFLFRDRKMRLLLLGLALGAAGIFSLVWSNPHYAAPFTVIILAIAVQAIRHLRVIHFRVHPVGVQLSRAIVVLLILDTGINVFRGVCDPLRWPCQGDPSRVAIAQKLSHTPGKHLVMVRYSKDNHNIHDEWVYNGADIGGAKVLWARELEPQQNAKLFAYFKDRQIWLVTPDSDNEYLERYTAPIGGLTRVEASGIP